MCLSPAHRCVCHRGFNLQGVCEKVPQMTRRRKKVKSPKEQLNRNKRPNHMKQLPHLLLQIENLCTVKASLCVTPHFLFFSFSSTWHFAPIWIEWVCLHLIWASQVNYFLKMLTQYWEHIWIIVFRQACQWLSLMKTRKNNVFCISDLPELKTSIEMIAKLIRMT